VLLKSILKQKILPKEVIIVDDSDNEKTKYLTNQMLKDFDSKKIKLKYMRGGGESVTQARNIGVAFSTGEIHCSLDDDVVLHKDYIENILRVYEIYPNALGVAGHIENLYLPGFPNALGRVFSFFYTEQDKCRVLPTGISYPVPLTHIIECEWLNGTNCSYKREILKNFKWDEKLKRYSLCDDIDISYRIRKKLPKSLFMTPYAKIIHTHSQLARITSEYRIHMEICYHTYFFFKNIKPTYRNMLSFVYGIFFGRIVTSILSGNPHSVVFTIKAQLYMIRNMGKVKQGFFKSF
jgi:glycosyltransferase involved in cell wall biosynthesis